MGVSDQAAQSRTALRTPWCSAGYNDTDGRDSAGYDGATLSGHHCSRRCPGFRTPTTRDPGPPGRRRVTPTAAFEIVRSNVEARCVRSALRSAAGRSRSAVRSGRRRPALRVSGLGRGRGPLNDLMNLAVRAWPKPVPWSARTDGRGGGGSHGRLSRCMSRRPCTGSRPSKGTTMGLRLRDQGRQVPELDRGAENRRGSRPFGAIRPVAADSCGGGPDAGMA